VEKKCYTIPKAVNKKHRKNKVIGLFTEDAFLLA